VTDPGRRDAGTLGGAAGSLARRTLRLTAGLAAGIVAFAFVAACGEAEPDGCVDVDGDGFGDGCLLGADCDDRNPARARDCDRVPPPDCAATPLAPGCPCVSGAVAPCYSGTPETDGVAACRGGRARCIVDFWSLCEGEIAPRPEQCNGVDDDCDGAVDEGVRSPCGGCDPACDGDVWGDPASPFTPGGGLDVSPEGRLVLARELAVRSVVWVPSSGDSTVSRIDAVTGVETARYASGGLDPSRVAVDYKGDAWVANRAFGAQGTVTKIAGEPARCVDRDGDGAIRTSTGPADVLPDGEDECVLFTVPVGAPGAVPRALAIDGDLGLDGVSGGDAWVGLHDARQVVELDGLTGAVRQTIDAQDVRPYAAHVDPWGTVWMAERDGRLLRIDRGPAPARVERIEAPLPCFLFYSLDGDAEGRLVMSGFSCDQLVTFDPLTRRWGVVPTGPSPRGVVVAPDGRVLVALTSGALSLFERASRAAPLREAWTVGLASGGVTPRESIGLGLDGLGRAWVVSTGGGTGDTGLATRVDPTTRTTTAHVDVGLAPHVQGDLTGSTLRGGFRPEGEASHVFLGCPTSAETEWVALHAEALLGPASEVRYALRHAATPETLGAAPFEEIGVQPGTSPPPWPLRLPTGGAVEVRVTLRTRSADGSPRVERVGVQWRCPGPI
jgi:DNA-binding beta-propeller fold protein YncE